MNKDLIDKLINIIKKTNTAKIDLEYINDIIDSAISHGGDSGGAYCSDWGSLEESIGEWLHAKGIETFFTACEDAIRPIKEIDILDYREDTKIWYCIVSEYRLDEITAKVK